MKNKITLLKISILLLFLFSGFCSLVYEVSWMRSFGLIFGNNTLAVSTVLSAFMLGLGLGAVVIGRYTPRLKNPLKTYGLLEIGIGITGLIVLVGTEVLQPFFSFVSRYFSDIPFILYLIKFLISFALMLPATFLMGGTLPVLVMALIWQNAKLGKEVGWLYGINTLGAVIGTIFSGFYSIRIYGLEQSLFIAAAANIFIGLVTLILSANRDMYKTILKAELPKETIAANEGRWIYIIFAITGFYALGYEVVWNRLLVFIMTNSVYAFTIMLATFLFGIALGSGIGSKLTGTKDLVRLFGILLGATVLFALFASIGLKYLPEIHNAVFVLMLAPGMTTWMWG